jgi:small-conductance mechanosensitive channel
MAYEYRGTHWLREGLWMLIKVLIFLGIVAAGLLAWIGNDFFPGQYLYQLSLTLWTIAGFYLFVKVLSAELFLRKIKDKMVRYSLNKVITILSAVVAIAIILHIWFPDTQSLVVAVGVISAGVVIALQDVFRNFAGGILIMTGNLYRVGDRIEIGGETGDVMDIGIMNTTMMELRGWIDSDQATGRITSIPNGKVITTQVHNYTKDHSFLWDEIMIPITYASNWKKAKEVMLEIVTRETVEIVKEAEAEIEKIGETYYLPRRMVEPAVYLTPTDNWITFHVRYVTRVKERRAFRTRISEMILEKVQDYPDISISSTTTTVTLAHSLDNSYSDMEKK